MDVIDRIKNIFVKDEIGEPPWEYDFLYNLPESEYPKYLKKIFKYRTGEDLPLKREHGQLVIDKNKCKTFNQKIQWLKLYDATQLKRDCTDKVKVRDYVAEKIGTEYLKPVLQICDSYDEINFDELPDAFVMKCNHGSKWMYVIKNKQEFLQNKRKFNIVKQDITGWLEQEFWTWNGFEMQYKGILPKIIIESFLADEKNEPCSEIYVYCINGKPKFSLKIHNLNEVSVYDEKLNITKNLLCTKERFLDEKPDEILMQSYKLSEKLLTTLNFNFVRIDWVIYKKHLFFCEMTFTPYSGFSNLFTKYPKELMFE